MTEIQQLPEEHNIGFGAGETNNLLDNPNLATAMKKMLELQLQVMLIPIVERIVGPMMENMVRKVVKEELEKFITAQKWKSGDERNVTQVQKLALQFSEHVPEQVFTGEELKGGGGDHLKLALVDPLTKSCVSSGPEASAEVELIVHSQDDDEVGNFKQKKAEDGRPLLSQSHVKLKDGIAVLDKIKFKHTAKWAKKFKVILVARANLNGMMIEAATEPFIVKDRRLKLKNPLCLSDDVGQLKEISRGGQLHKSLIDAKVSTVEEFLRLLNMNPDNLQKILNVTTKKFQLIVDHAKTCPIGENLYLYNSTSSERKVRAVFNAVGCLRGLLYDDKYVPVDKLSKDEKADAHKIMASAFLDLGNAETIENESSIVHFVSQTSNATGANTSSAPRTENASRSNFSPQVIVPAGGYIEPIEKEASTSHLAPGSSKGNGTNISISPRTENATGSTFSPERLQTVSEGIDPIENQASVSSHANAAESSSTFRSDSMAGNNVGTGMMIDESYNCNALLCAAPRPLSPFYCFDFDAFNVFDLPANNMDVFFHEIDYPIHSSDANEEYDQHPQLHTQECSDRGTTAVDEQMPGIHVPSSSMARQRWRMAVRIVALGDIQERKRRKLE